MLKPILGLALACAVLGLPPALAQQTSAISVAASGSVVETAGSTILYFVGGRSREEAAAVNGEFNPFGIDGEDLLFTLGAFFVTVEYEDGPVHEGELSIYPQFRTPIGAFDASEATPAIIPFALMQGGVCHAGFVSGHPVPAQIHAVDMAEQICHAAIVEEIVYADYLSRGAAPVADPGPDEQPPADRPATVFDPANPTPLALDTIVWAAYNGAFSVAMADADYLFVRDGDDRKLRDAIAAEFAKEGFDGVAIIDVPTPAEAYGCAAPGAVELRVALAAGNAGITLVAATSRLVSAYTYDPDVSADLDIDYARECRTEGPGRLGSSGVR